MSLVLPSEPFRDESGEWLSDRVGALAEKHGFRSLVEDYDARSLIRCDNGIHRRRDDPFKLRLLRRQLLVGPAVLEVQLGKDGNFGTKDRWSSL